VLSRIERAVWIRMLAYETRTDAVSVKAQGVIVRTLDGVAGEGTWCACPDHEEALDHVLGFVWRQPPI
jgi:hypothetical protein